MWLVVIQICDSSNKYLLSIQLTKEAILTIEERETLRGITALGYHATTIMYIMQLDRGPKLSSTIACSLLQPPYYQSDSVEGFTGENER